MKVLEGRVPCSVDAAAKTMPQIDELQLWPCRLDAML
jgi:hypothetical protein